jgi:Na+/glutamate symporter
MSNLLPWLAVVGFLAAIVVGIPLADWLLVSWQTRPRIGRPNTDYREQP